MGQIYQNLTPDEITQLEFQAGKKAAELIDKIMSEKLNAQFKTADNGKILQVGADGKVVPVQSSEGMTVDDTLSIEGAAADAKATGDKFNDVNSTISDVVKQELNETLTKPSSGNAIATVAFRVIKNQAYLLTVDSLGSVTINTRITASGENLERVYSGGPCTNEIIVPTEDAGYLRIVAAKDADVSIKTLTAKEAYEIAHATSEEAPLFSKNYSGLINGTSVVSDLDDVTDNINYRMNFSLGSSSIPANTPYGTSWGSSAVAFFQSVVKTAGAHSAGDIQLFIGSDAVYVRYYAAAWLSWQKLYSDVFPREFVVDINGTGDYTSLCAAIDAAVEYPNSIVRVKRGTYNAIDEMKALKGSSYFDNFATSTDQIYVRNGLKVICEPGTILEAHYTGANTVVNTHYAPLNFSNSDGYIEGLEIDASNCRYCIHDDQWTYTEPYKHTLKNCRLIMDNSQNAAWDRRLAFGGGLGVNGYIIFEGCYFKAAGLPAEYNNQSIYGSAGYHNSPDSNAQSTLVINNCYFADGSTFRLTRHGDSTKMTRAFVSGCSLGREMELTYEQTSTSAQNCEIIDCNNVIRT